MNGHYGTAWAERAGIYHLIRDVKITGFGIVSVLLKHGVRSCFEYAKSFDLKRAHALSNPDLAPHLEFVDMGGNGYAKVRLSINEMRTEFVCIPRPISRSEGADGGPIRYRVAHTAALWQSGERPHLKAAVLEGDVGLSI